MPTIIALNPRGKGKKKKKKKKKKRALTALQKKYFGTKAQRKGTKKMAKKKKKKRPAMTALQKKYFGTKAQRKGSTAMAGKKKKKRSNPKKKSRKRSSTPRATTILMGAAKSMVPLLFGALSAKFFAKKFAEGGSESDNWNWKNYALAGAATVGTAFLVGMVLKKKAPAQKVLEGGGLLLLYKLFTNEIAPMNQYTESWFGGAEDQFDPYNGLDAGQPGDLWEADNETFVKGIDGYWRPASENHRIPAGNRGVSDMMVPPDPRYGDVMVPPDARYGAADINQMIQDDQM